MIRASRNAPFAALFVVLLVAGGLGSPGLAARPAPQPVPGGPIGTLELGLYRCERDGTAGGPVGIRLPQYDFRAVTGSNYKTMDGVRGSYLMTGDRVVMTGGKLKGLRMHRTSRGFLRHTDAEGADRDIRCVLSRAGGGPLDPAGNVNEPET